MFTGIIAAVGTVRSVERVGDGLQLSIDSSFTRLVPGESVAVDGACLTVETRAGGRFSVRVITTSLARTAFGQYEPGRRVNLERALRAADRLGGHLVQGHVDGLGRVVRVGTVGDARILDLAVPAEVAEVSIPLGSICVDGVSLTVNALPAPEIVQVSLIPFTLQHTTLGERVAGDAVHLEGDTVGKYVRHFTAAHAARLKA